MLINDSQSLAQMGGINSTRAFVLLCRLAPGSPLRVSWCTISRINVPFDILGAQRPRPLRFPRSPGSMTQPLQQCCAQHMAALVLIRVVQRLSHTFSLEHSLDVWVIMRIALRWERSLLAAEAPSVMASRNHSEVEKLSEGEPTEPDVSLGVFVSPG